MYLDDLIKLLELIQVKYGDIPSYLLNKQFDLFTEINRVYVEEVEDEKILILSDETCKEVKENKTDKIKKSFKNKAELISYIETNTNVTLENDPADLCNKKRYILHTVINKIDRLNVLSFLNKRGIRVEEHLYDSYYIYLK